MAKLYFRFGSMGSGKSLNLLAVAHNYRQQGKEVLLFKPKLDNRFGVNNIKSRAGIEMKVDLLLEPKVNIINMDFKGIYCLLIDEAQFVSKKHIEEFRDIANDKQIPVICYGLKTDFRGLLFEGSKRLIELADKIEEIKTTCFYCNKKATFNLRHVNGEAVDDGPVIQLGADEAYFPACYGCYKSEISKSKKNRQTIKN